MQNIIVGLCGPARHDIPNVNHFLFPAVVVVVVVVVLLVVVEVMVFF